MSQVHPFNTMFKLTWTSHQAPAFSVISFRDGTVRDFSPIPKWFYHKILIFFIKYRVFSEFSAKKGGGLAHSKEEDEADEEDEGDEGAGQDGLLWRHCANLQPLLEEGKRNGARRIGSVVEF